MVSKERHKEPSTRMEHRPQHEALGGQDVCSQRLWNMRANIEVRIDINTAFCLVAETPCSISSYINLRHPTSDMSAAAPFEHWSAKLVTKNDYRSKSIRESPSEYLIPLSLSFRSTSSDYYSRLLFSLGMLTKFVPHARRSSRGWETGAGAERGYIQSPWIVTRRTGPIHSRTTVRCGF